MRWLRLMVALMGMALLVAPAGVSAIVITPNNTWYAFDVDRFNAVSGSVEWIDLDGEALTFEFTTVAPAILTVVDAGFGGDVFAVFDRLTLLGTTSPATDTYPDSLGIDFDAALADARWSRGVYVLDAGSYSISGVLSRSAVDDSGLPIDATVGAIRVSTVPEPATWGLLMTGMLLLFGMTFFHQYRTRKDVV